MKKSHHHKKKSSGIGGRHVAFQAGRPGRADSRHPGVRGIRPPALVATRRWPNPAARRCIRERLRRGGIYRSLQEAIQTTPTMALDGVNFLGAACSEVTVGTGTGTVMPVGSAPPAMAGGGTPGLDNQQRC